MRRIYLFSLLVALFFVLSACGKNDNPGATNVDGEDLTKKYNLVEPGKLTIVSSGGFVPFTDMEDGKMVGYDIDVGTEIAKILGLEPNFKKAEFSGMITGIQQGRYDIAINSHTITEERKEQVNFTHPYYYSGSMIFVRPGSDIQTVEDIRGKTIALNRGTSYHTEALEYTDKFDFYDDDLRALQAVESGRGDAGITDAIIGQMAIEAGLNLEAREQFNTTAQAIPIDKDNVALLEAINAAMEQLQANGKLTEISMKWVGVDVSKPPEGFEE